MAKCKCGRKIKTMTFVGTGVCSDLCNKVRDGKLTPQQAEDHRPNMVQREFETQTKTEQKAQRKSAKF